MLMRARREQPYSDDKGAAMKSLAMDTAIFLAIGLACFSCLDQASGAFLVATRGAYAAGPGASLPRILVPGLTPGLLALPPMMVPLIPAVVLRHITALSLHTQDGSTQRCQRTGPPGGTAQSVRILAMATDVGWEPTRFRLLSVGSWRELDRVLADGQRN
jgi:hypothetical protein